MASGTPAVEAAGLDPFLLVDDGLLVEEGPDGLRVLVPGDPIAQRIGALADAGDEGEGPVGARKVGPGQASRRGNGGLAGEARPDQIDRAPRRTAAPPDLAVGEEGELALAVPREIVDERDADVLRKDDAADDGPFVAARPFDRQGLAPGRRLHQHGRRTAHLERQPEIEGDPGVEAVGRVGTDVGDEVIEVGALGGLPFPLDPQEEGVGAVGGRSDDQPGPARGVERPDAGVLPGIEDLGGQSRRAGQDEGDDEDRFSGHPGDSGRRPPRRPLYAKKMVKSRRGSCFSSRGVID